MKNRVISTRNTSLYGSQTLPTVFCIQNSDFSTRIASLYRSQPSSEVFACKTTTFGSEKQVSMGPRFRLLICEWKQRAYIQNDACLLFPNFICGFAHSQQDFSIRITSLYGSQPSFAAFACKTATLGPELQVSKGPRTHLWFFVFKTANLARELQVPMGPNPHLWVLHAKLLL